MAVTVEQLAHAIDASFVGRGDLVIRNAAEPAQAGSGDVALAMKPEYAEELSKGAARVAVLWDGADWGSLGLDAALFVRRPRYAMSGITSVFDRGPEIAPGIHPSAVVDATAEIGAGVAIGPLAVIGPDAVIEDNVRIAAQATIAEGARIGSQSLIHSGVRVGPRVVLGDRVILQPNSVIGADGFSFVTPEKSAVENVRDNLGGSGAVDPQSWTRIHSLGTVEIGDDVEVGANSAIDRGTIRATRIGRGTKIDNLVQIGHNVLIGEDCLLCGHVGIAGSTRIGNRVVLAGMVGVNDNIVIGDDVVAGGGTKIFTRVPAGRVILGHPATKMENQLETYKALRRLPRLFRQVAELQKAISKTRQTD